MNKVVRTRIAPSPTGKDLHIGNAYTALINFAFAQKHHGQFVIRIEDTDRNRFVSGSESRILNSLNWLGLTHHEGPDIHGPYSPYRQSERLSIYKEYAEKLIAAGHAYYCFCTSDRLDQMRKNQESQHLPPMYDGHCRNLNEQISMTNIKQKKKHVIRLKVPEAGITSFKDLIRGNISFENKLIDDQVLLKSDGFPTYHLGVVVDDHLMQISHIIRGEEWISSTPKHILLYQFLGWTPPVFAHIPLLRNPDKSKLSKRKNPVWVSWYKEQGFLPEALLNYLSLMAWSHPEGKEIFTFTEFIEKFTLEKVQTTAPVFDLEKLRWLNGEYLRQKSDPELKELIYQRVNTLTYEHESLVNQIIPLIRARMKTLSEFQSLAGFFFTKPKEYERHMSTELLKVAQSALANSEWNHQTMEASIRQACQKASIKPKDVFMELRLAITGKTVGPPLLESLEILDKNETLDRINKLLSPSTHAPQTPS